MRAPSQHLLDDSGSTPASVAAIRDDRSTSILLKKSEIEVPRKSRFRAHRVVSTSSCHNRAKESVVRRKIGRSAEPLRKFPSRLSAVFGIVIEAEIRVFQQYSSVRDIQSRTTECPQPRTYTA